MALRCGRRLELDLGHQRERVSREAAKQPTELAGGTREFGKTLVDVSNLAGGRSNFEKNGSFLF